METKEEKKPNFLKWALIIGIVVVLNLFFNYSISLFYKAPDYNAFCSPMPIATTPQDESAISAQETLCENNFQTAQNTYSRNTFITLFVLGVISLILGVFIANEIVSLALSWGGVLSLVVASMRYWSDADNWVKVLILGVALAALIWVAFKKFGKQIA